MPCKAVAAANKGQSSPLYLLVNKLVKVSPPLGRTNTRLQRSDLLGAATRSRNIPSLRFALEGNSTLCLAAGQHAAADLVTSTKALPKRSRPRPQDRPYADKGRLAYLRPCSTPHTGSPAVEAFRPTQPVVRPMWAITSWSRPAAKAISFACLSPKRRDPSPSYRLQPLRPYFEAKKKIQVGTLF